MPGTGKARVRQLLFQGQRRGKGIDGVGEIAVSGIVAGKKPADTGQDAAQIEIIQPAPDALPAGTEFQNAGASAGGQHAQHLPESLVARGDVADAEGDGHAVHGGIGQGELLGVGGHGQNGRGVPAVQLARAALQHGQAEVQRRNARIGIAAPDGQRHIQRSGGQIKDAPGGSQAHIVGQHAPPVTVDAKAQHSIAEVIPARDTAEHTGNGLIVPPDLRCIIGYGIHAAPPCFPASAALSRMASRTTRYTAGKTSAKLPGETVRVSINLAVSSLATIKASLQSLSIELLVRPGCPGRTVERGKTRPSGNGRGPQRAARRTGEETETQAPAPFFHVKTGTNAVITPEHSRNAAPWQGTRTARLRRETAIIPASAWQSAR